MSKSTIDRLHRIYNALAALSVIAAGIALIAGCLAIYRAGGDEPYSREIVAQMFSRVCVPVYICLGLVIGGFVFDALSPLQEKKAKPAFAGEFKRYYAKLSSKEGFEESSETFLAEIKKVRSERVVWNASGALIAVLCIGIFFAYATDPARYDSADITGSVIDAMKVMVPCMLVAFAEALALYVHNQKSRRQEMGLTALLRRGESRDREETVKTKNPVNTVRVLRAIFIVAALIFLIVGAASGGFADVLTKAVNICTECIGLG